MPSALTALLVFGINARAITQRAWPPIFLRQGKTEHIAVLFGLVMRLVDRGCMGRVISAFVANCHRGYFHTIQSPHLFV